jgi:hypothetical protein
MSDNYQVQCPKCKNIQRYENRKNITTGVKKCVFCGKSFKVHTNIGSLSRIVKKENYRNTDAVNHGELVFKTYKYEEKKC